MDSVGVFPVEDPARRLDDLPESPSAQLRRLGSTAGMIDELIDVMKDALDEGVRRVRIL